MPRNNTTTPDDDHVQFGNQDSYNTTGLPSDFGAGMGDYEFCPNWFGRVMVNPQGGGFGAAEIDPEDRYRDQDEE